MNPTLLVFAAELVFAAIVLFLLPHISPRRIFFAVTVAPDFPASPQGRAILRRYRIAIAVISAASAVAFALTSSRPVVASAVAMLLPLFAGGVAYLVARSRTAPFAAPLATVHEASLDPEHDRLPRWFPIAFVPFVFPAAAAAYLAAHWDQIPARFPIHWGADGVANGWSERTVRGVFGPEIGCSALLVLLLFLAAATFYGARRAEMRTATLKIVVASCFFISLLFSALSLTPLLHLPIWLILIPALLFPLAILVWVTGLVADPKFQAEATPDACWYLGQIYYNPSDPALFVQKRMGFGYTFNFANRLTWLIVAGLIVVIVGLVVAMP